jgi:7-cyano-7-deazaguanine synthase
MARAVVLVSGGLDSCVAAAIAAVNHDLCFLHLNYRQRTEKRELQAFNAIADHYRIDQLLVVDVGYMQEIGGSSLVDPHMPIPQDHSDEIPDTYVPFRNANILGIGVAWAESIGASDLFIGAHQTAAPYPDCRAQFFAAYQHAIDTGTRPQTQIHLRTPLIDLDKTAIVRRGLELDAPLHLTWSCYQNEINACGRCHSCVLRRQAFGLAGVADPVL